MHRRLFGRISAAVALAALAVPVSLIAASPSQAATTCTSQMGSNIAGGQSNLSVACLTDYNSPANTGAAAFIQIADSPAGVWRRGSARQVTGTGALNGTTITVLASTPVVAGDIGRPISGPGVGAGAFITAVAGNVVTVSRKNAAAIPGGSTLTIEHSTARVLFDANCTTGTTNMTAPLGKFTASDVLRSVGGGPYPPGSRIVVVPNATTATVDANASVAGNQAPPANCTDAFSGAGQPAGVQDIITIGAAKYTAATGTTTSYTDGYTRHVMLGAAPAGGATCAGSTLTFNASGGGVFATDLSLRLTFRKSSGALADATVRKVNTANTAGNGSIVMSAACPLAGAAATSVDIGQPSDSAPHDDGVVTQTVSALQLNPTLVPTIDDCARNTYEGFTLAGTWRNPSSVSTKGYALTGVLGAPPAVSVGQFLMGTGAGVDFAGYLQAVNGGLQVGAHFEVVFPLVPTTLALCPAVAGTGKIASAWRFLASPETGPPTTPVTGGDGSGNPQGPSVRALGPTTGVVAAPKVVLKTIAAALLTPAGGVSASACTVIAQTAVPNWGCGDG